MTPTHSGRLSKGVTLPSTSANLSRIEVGVSVGGTVAQTNVTAGDVAKVIFKNDF